MNWKNLGLKILIGLDVLVAFTCKVIIDFLGWTCRVLRTALVYLQSKLEN